MFLSSINKKVFYLSLTVFMFVLILSMQQLQENRESMAAKLAPSVLRFHIMANSDSATDQEVKLQVRSLILDYIKTNGKTENKADTIQYLKSRKADLESLANNYLQSRGFDYTSRLEITNCYFPTRIYDHLVIPCGYYDAARIVLGTGEGHNWWCVLYPRFCFTDAACTSVPKESLDTLEKELKKDDFLALMDSRPQIEFRSFLFPTLFQQDRQSPSHNSP